MKRTERKTKLPGIYKEFYFDENKNDWLPTGRYRAISLKGEDGSPAKKKIFSSLQEAKEFRLGPAETKIKEPPVELTEANALYAKYTFSNLIEDWKQINFAQIEQSSKETYEKYIKFFEALMFFENINKPEEVSMRFMEMEVFRFNIEKVDELVLTLMSDHTPKTKKRESFKKEIKFLDQLFKFYARRKNPTFPNPVLKIHYRKCVIRKKAKNANKEKYLRADDLPKFLDQLRKLNNPTYYYVALCQFYLGLRIGEACGIEWEGLSEEKKTWRIKRVISWVGSQRGVIKDLPKDDEIRDQPFSDHFLSEMLFYKRLVGGKSGLVFEKQGKPLRRNTVVRAYNSALKACGITYTSGSHMLRKTSATLGFQVTKDTLGASGFLGHSNIKVTDDYLGRGEQKSGHAEALDEVYQSARRSSGEEPPAVLKLVP